MADLTHASYGEQDLPVVSQKELLKRYRHRVETAKTWRKAEGFDDTWKRLRDLYRLKMHTGWDDEDKIGVAISFATINVIAPSVAVNHPKITVNARDELEKDKAVITEAVINYWWRHFDVKPEFRQAVKDFLVYGHGWIKVTYHYEEIVTDADEEVMLQRFGEAKMAVEEASEADPANAASMPTDTELLASLDTSEIIVTEDRPYAERVSPFDIFPDPEATCMYNLQWIAQRVVRPFEEVKNDQRLNARVRNKLKPDGSVKWQNEDSKDNVPEDAGRITTWEFYDLQRKTVCVFTEIGDGFLLKPEPMPYTYGLPYVMLRNYEVPDQFYPIGELEALESLQDELNDTRTTMREARLLDKRKFLYRKAAFSQAGLDALRSNKNNTGIPVEDDTPFDQLIMPMPRNEASVQLYQHSDVIEEDIDRVSGINEYMRGALPEIRRTATEASIIQDAANARAADKLDQIEGAIAEVAEKLIALAQEYMTGDKVARIVGPDGAMIWAPFTREDITGEFDYDVEAGSTQPMNETFRRQQAQQMAMALGPYVGTVINPFTFVAHLMKEGFGIQHPERFLLDPMAMAPQPGAQPGGPPGEEPPPEEEEDRPDGTDAVADAQLNQLSGQVGLSTNTMGGGALGPGAG